MQGQRIAVFLLQWKLEVSISFDFVLLQDLLAIVVMLAGFFGYVG